MKQRKMMSRLARAVALTAALILAVPAHGIIAQTAAPLTGEVLAGYYGIQPTPPPPVCDPSGFTYSYSTSGPAGGRLGFDVDPAAGPYPGTFEESGTVRVGPDRDPGEVGGTVPNGTIVRNVILSFQANFTIYSGNTVITGRKDFTASAAGPNSTFTCADFSATALRPGQTVPDRLYIRQFRIMDARYEATIATPTGTYQDSGMTTVELASNIVNDETGISPLVVNSARFREYFTSSDGVVALGPALVSLSPATATNTVGTSHTVTAIVTNASGGSVANSTVRFTVAGSVTTTGICTTAADGTCTFSYPGPAFPGADAISACADANNSGTCDAGEPTAEAIKAWILPASTPGQVTGGGHFINPADNEKVAFGFNAQSAANGLKGNCTVVDIAPSRNVKIKCLDVTALVQTATSATVYGHAQINGVATDYRIDVTDLAEPGKGRDTFAIQTTSGYSAGGTLDGGNVQVHRAD